MTSDNHPSQAALIEQLTRKISGFKPAMTGGICDSCNAGLSEADTVYVYADWQGDWRIARTSCASCGAQLDDRQLVEAIAECELGHSPDGEFYPLHNPSVEQLNTSDGAVLR